MSTLENVNDFAAFARTRIEAGSDSSIDELYADWRQNVFRAEDAAAIMASVRDVENGERGRSLQEFVDEVDQQQSNGEP